MDNFLNWFGKHRKSIGYVIGGLNLGSGLVLTLGGNYMYGMLWLVVGALIIIDTKEFK
jgi:hypothetical protein